MDKYKVTVCSTREVIVEAENELDATDKGLSVFTDSCHDYSETREVTKIVNLTGDPHELLVELAMRLEQVAYRNDICRYCGGGTLCGHSANCIIERARHCVEQHRRKLDEVRDAISELDRTLRIGGFGDCHCCGFSPSKGHAPDCPVARLTNYIEES